MSGPPAPTMTKARMPVAVRSINWFGLVPEKEQTMSASALPPAWRIEGRPNPFVPWVFVKTATRIESAAAEVAGIKARFQFYAVRVRAN